VEGIPAPRRAGLVLAALALAALALPVRAAAATDLLPDLVSDPPSGAALQYSSSGLGGSNMLLRFDGYVHNAGAGAFELDAQRTGSGPLTPLQRVFDSGGGFRDDPMPNAQLAYSNADGHNHWHLQDIARYSLWNDDRSGEVAPSLKVGFCIEDTEHVDPFGPANAGYDESNGRDFCQKGHPETATLFEGISSGWRDTYDQGLPFQWVVVSDVQPGAYWLREDIDLTDAVHESDETNAPAWSANRVTIPGYVAKPVTAPPSGYGQALDVALEADVFGSPGARRFRVVTPPAHGTLSVTTGDAFAGATVTYTPAAGYSGPDQFTYRAFDSTSPYPLNPPTATVALSVAAPPAPKVVIDTAPTSVDVSHGAQLHATVTNDVGGVIWSVDGIDGGGAVAGTITPNGFYTAPASVPPAGHVTIAARSASGAHDERTVEIADPLPPPPTPDPEPVTDPHRSNGPVIGPLAIARRGSVLVASVRVARAGIVRIGARAGERRIGSCEGRVPKGAHFACRLSVAPWRSLARLKVVAKLIRGEVVIARVARAGPPARR
jgi:lysyl oxidase/Big-like domain-containing protein